MFVRALIWITLILLSSCVQHQNEPEEIASENSFDVKIEYAEGFEIKKLNGNTHIISKSFGENQPFRDSLMILHPEGEKTEGKWIPSKLSSIASQSSTHLAFLEVIGVLELVKGHCGMQFISNQKVIEQLKKNRAIEICTGDATNLESLLKIDPDLYLIYPFENSEIDDFERNGINTFFIAEYLETTPLARLEWIKLFGVIFNQYNRAEDYFNLIAEEYLNQKVEEKDTSKKFILNLPFEDAWYMPSSKSFLVNLIEDAGLSYFYDDQAKTENFLRSTEEVWEDGIEAEYWVIIASRPEKFTLDDLIAESPVYKEFKSVKNGNVIFCNTGVNEYFSTGVVEPDIMLKDILFATNHLENHTPKYFQVLR